MDHQGWHDHSSETDVPALTFNGRLLIRPVAPIAGSAFRFATLGGDQLIVGTPPKWTLSDVAAVIEFERRGVRKGFARAWAGTALYNLLAVPKGQIHPEALVRIGEGLLGHYNLSMDEGWTSFSIWQGPHSEVYAWGLAPFERALHEFSSAVIRDHQTGAVIKPPPGWDLDVDEIAMDAGEWLVTVRKRSEFMVPLWSGAQGRYLQLYRPDPEPDDSSEAAYIVAVSLTVLADVRRANHGEPITDVDVAQIAAGLRLEWK